MKIFSKFYLFVLFGSLTIQALHVGNFEGKTLDGKSFSMTSLFGAKKKILISFWATWCEPCQDELKLLNSYVGKQALRWEILSVNVDSGDTVSNVLKTKKQLRLDFPIVMDSNGEYLSKLNPSKTLPFSVAVESDGSVFKIMEGFHAEELKDLLEKP